MYNILQQYPVSTVWASFAHSKDFPVSLPATQGDSKNVYTFACKYRSSESPRIKIHRPRKAKKIGNSDKYSTFRYSVAGNRLTILSTLKNTISRSVTFEFAQILFVTLLWVIQVPVHRLVGVEPQTILIIRLRRHHECLPNTRTRLRALTFCSTSRTRTVAKTKKKIDETRIIS